MRNNLIISIGFIIAGVALSVFGLFQMTAAHKSKSWPSTLGEILTSSVQERRGAIQESDIVYKAKIKYSYSVHGKKLVSDKVSFSDFGNSSKKKAHQIVKRYPAGKKVRVYYSPKRTEVAVLETGISWTIVLSFVTGIILFVGGFIIYIMIKMKK